MRIAVFVDAGYLFAGGGTALTGRTVRRIDLSLSSASTLDELKAFAKLKAPDSSLLRIYWYDGIRSGNAMSADQATIADLDDVKLRLGFINGRGEQKGVDSLIVTDLIELVEALKRKCRKVSVVSTTATQPPMIADDLRRQADHFIDFSSLRDQIGRDPSERPQRPVESMETAEL